MILNNILRCIEPGERRPMNTESIRYLVIHRISFAEKAGDNPSPIPDPWLDGPALATRFRQMPNIGRMAYHFLIHADGLIEQCLPLTQRGAHAPNYNYRSIAVALAGDFRHKTPDTEQFASLLNIGVSLLPICREMVRHDGLPAGSCEPGKICPGQIAVPLVQQAVIAKLPQGWAEWPHAKALEWAKGMGVTV